MKRASDRQLPVFVSQISITALLDLVLILLLVFVVTVPLLRREKAATLPVWTVAAEATAPGVFAPKKVVELKILPDQSLVLDGKTVTGASLLPEIKKRVEAQPDLGVLVQMPANFAAGSLARLMDEMHRAGVRHTSVEVVEKPKP